MRRLMLVSSAVLASLAQEAPVADRGVIIGTVSGEDGSIVAGAYVTLHLAAAPGDMLRQGFRTQWGVSSGTDGSFKFSGLRNGNYRLCAQAPGSVWLDPCEWGFASPAATLSDAANSQTIRMVLRRGAEVSIRVDDPGQLMLQHEGKTAGAHLLVGVTTAASTFRPAVQSSKEGAGRTLKVVIPFDRRVNVAAASSFFALADGNGIPFSKPGAAIPVTVPTGQSAPNVRLRVTGRR